MRARPAYQALVLATGNAHKVKEIKHILAMKKIKIRVLSVANFRGVRPVIENRSTIKGNAVKKAREIARQTGHLALADDTGLFIRALRGKPGVYSARFAGPKCNYLDNNRKVLRLMAHVSPGKRQATFRTVAALATPKGRVFTAEGRLDGRISTELRGKRGFGYDPVFYVPRFNKTLAEMSLMEKNKISHRARAFVQVPALLKKAVIRGHIAINSILR